MRIVQSCVQHQPLTARSIQSAAQQPKSASTKSPRIKVHKESLIGGSSSSSQVRGPLVIARLLQQHHLLVDILRHIATSATGRTATVAAAIKVASNKTSANSSKLQSDLQRTAMLSSLEALAGKISPGSGKNSPSQQLFNNNGLENNNNNTSSHNNNTNSNATTKVAVFNQNIHPYQKLQDINSNREQ